MEVTLRQALAQAIPELEGSIYPTNSPETATRPYLVYARINTDRDKTLKGYTDNQRQGYMFSCMAAMYSDMKSLTNKVEAFLLSLPRTMLGDTEVKDLDINNISEQYEHQLKVNRGIIDFTIYI